MSSPEAPGLDGVEDLLHGPEPSGRLREPAQGRPGVLANRTSQRVMDCATFCGRLAERDRRARGRREARRRWPLTPRGDRGTGVFSLVRRGYDPAEVDDFLKEVADRTRAPAPGRVSAAPPAPAAAAADAPAPADGRARAGHRRVPTTSAASATRSPRSCARPTSRSPMLRHRAEAEAALIRQEAEHARPRPAGRRRPTPIEQRPASRGGARGGRSASAECGPGKAAAEVADARLDAQAIAEVAETRPGPRPRRRAGPAQRARPSVEGTRGRPRPRPRLTVEEDDDLFHRST